MTTITATVQAGLRVQLVIEDLPPTATRVLSVRRIAFTADPVFTGPVRGTLDLAPAEPLIVADVEAPIGSPVAWVVSWINADRSIGTATTVTITLTAAKPRLSDPVTGEYVEGTVETWPSIDVETGTVVLDVHTRRGARAIVVSGPPKAGSSQIVMRLDPSDAGGPRQFERLLAAGRVLLLRAPCPTVEGYLAVTSYQIARVTNAASDARRRITANVRHVSAPDTITPAQAATLTDLATVEPGTLFDISTTWPTLRDIAVADLGA